MTKDLPPASELSEQPLLEASYLKDIDQIRQDQTLTPPKAKKLADDLELETVSDRAKFLIRLGVFTACLSFLIIGRAVIPANEVPKLVDNVMDLFNGWNEYIRAHRTLQDIMLIICSLFMDVMFFCTGFYWVFRGKSSRLIVTTLSFYFLRSAVQQMWYSPFPPGYVWDDPGFPSLVVPYGRTSDFYFSGHIGIVTICICEWIQWKKYWASALIFLGGVYTCFIMLAYQAHYSIDLFTGIVCGHWMFMLVDKNKEKIDALFLMIFNLVKSLGKLAYKTQIKPKAKTEPETEAKNGRQDIKE